MTHQLAFPFPHTDDYDPAALLRGVANTEAMEWLERPAEWPGLRLAVHGAAGSGKTHLLCYFAARNGAQVLHGSHLRGLPPPPKHPLAIDDADACPEPRSLLHLLNSAAESRHPVLLAARTPPARWPATLPDLDSRLRAIIAVGIGPPDDAMLRALLARLMADRQVRVDAPTQDYLLARLPRSFAAMREAASRLDRASLETGRGVTRHLAAQVLSAMQAETDPLAAQDDDFVADAAEPSQNATPLL